MAKVLDDLLRENARQNTRIVELEQAMEGIRWLARHRRGHEQIEYLADVALIRPTRGNPNPKPKAAVAV